MSSSVAITSAGVFIPASVCARLRWPLARDLEAAQRDRIPVDPDISDAVGIIYAVGAAWDAQKLPQPSADLPMLDGRSSEPVEWIPVIEAAAILNRSTRAVTGRLTRGTLRGEKTGRSWRVDRASLDRKDS